MKCSDQDIRKALEVYKSYFDQSELLMLSLDVIDKVEFVSLSSHQSHELKLLIKFAITFVSLINLHSLAEGFNQNRNIWTSTLTSTLPSRAAQSTRLSK